MYREYEHTNDLFLTDGQMTPIKNHKRFSQTSVSVSMTVQDATIMNKVHGYEP